MARVLIVNPLASGVTEPELAAVQAALPPGTETVLTHARGHAVELAREWSPGSRRCTCSRATARSTRCSTASPPTSRSGSSQAAARACSRGPSGCRATRSGRRNGLRSGTTRRISLGTVNGRRFGFNAGIGFDAELVRRVDALGRRSDGKRPGTSPLRERPCGCSPTTGFATAPAIEIEGLGRAAFAFVANCSPYTYLGRLGLRIAPDATFDGGLDIVAPIELRARSLPGLGIQAWRGRTERGGTLYRHDADRIRIRCDTPLPLQVDGEDMGDVSEVELVAERDAVTVLV